MKDFSTIINFPHHHFLSKLKTVLGPKQAKYKANFLWSYSTLYISHGIKSEQWGLCHNEHFHFLRLDLLSRPRGAWAFDKLRRFHTRPLRFNWGPKNVHFGKTHFRDPNIDASIFRVSTKNSDKYQTQMFCVFHCGT